MVRRASTENFALRTLNVAWSEPTQVNEGNNVPHYKLQYLPTSPITDL